MTGLSFKSAVFSLVLVCFLSGSAVADTFTFTGDAFLNAEDMSFNLSGPSFNIGSSFIFGPNAFALCTEGTLCTIPAQDIPANSGGFAGGSGGTVGGVTADTLVGGLTFSSFSFTAESGGGSGPVTFTGHLTGYATNDLGPQVFDLQISGSGTGTAGGPVFPGGGPFAIRAVEYTFSGTATTVTPEPSSVLLLSSGLIGIAAIRRWHLLRRVNH